jgi:hypothetical protein
MACPLKESKILVSVKGIDGKVLVTFTFKLVFGDKIFKEPQRRPMPTYCTYQHQDLGLEKGRLSNQGI